MPRRALLVIAALATAVPAFAQNGTVTVKPGPPPGLEFGEWATVDFRVKLQVDFHDYAQDLEPDGGNAEFRRARVGIEGQVFHDVEYQIQAELRDLEQPWRDVYARFRRYPAAEVTGGRFKVPFGREQLTSVFAITFVERALISSILAPARDEGVMLHGRVADRTLEYQTGVFQHDGDNASFGDNPGANASWAGRLVWAPWRNGSGPLRQVEAGAGLTLGDVPEGLNGLRGVMSAGYLFFEPVYVRGRRTRTGIDGSWTAGPGQLTAEYIRVADQRLGQSIDNRDLPDVIGQGWYVSGSWLLTGEAKRVAVEPKRPIGRGAGAIEGALRFEALEFGSGSGGGEPAFSNRRAPYLLTSRDTVLTMGLNWYLNRLGRVTVNARRDHLSDPRRMPQPARQTFWGAVVRLQFVL